MRGGFRCITDSSSRVFWRKASETILCHPTYLLSCVVINFLFSSESQQSNYYDRPESPKGSSSGRRATKRYRDDVPGSQKKPWPQLSRSLRELVRSCKCRAEYFADRDARFDRWFLAAGALYRLSISRRLGTVAIDRFGTGA